MTWYSTRLLLWALFRGALLQEVCAVASLVSLYALSPDSTRLMSPFQRVWEWEPFLSTFLGSFKGVLFLIILTLCHTSLYDLVGRYWHWCTHAEDMCVARAPPAIIRITVSKTLQWSTFIGQHRWNCFKCTFIKILRDSKCGFWPVPEHVHKTMAVSD